MESAKGQVDLHKKAADKQAQEKVAKAMFVVKKVQDVASVFEEHSKEEYERIIQAAKAKEKEILSEAKLEAKKIVQDADGDLDEFKIERMQEVERNMVKMVMAVTEKVLEQSLTTRQHKELIYQALDEIKTKKSRS